MSIKVEPMREHDAGEVCALFLQVLAAVPYYNDAAKAAERSKYSPALLLESIGSDPDAVLLAKSGGELEGYCFSGKDDGLIWIYWFGVHPGHRRAGVGSALLNAVEERARRASAHKVWCDCRTENTESRMTLIRNRFQPLCTIANHWHGQDFTLWEKLVAPSN